MFSARSLSDASLCAGPELPWTLSHARLCGPSRIYWHQLLGSSLPACPALLAAAHPETPVTCQASSARSSTSPVTSEPDGTTAGVAVSGGPLCHQHCPPLSCPGLCPGPTPHYSCQWCLQQVNCGPSQVTTRCRWGLISVLSGPFQKCLGSQVPGPTQMAWGPRSHCTSLPAPGPSLGIYVRDRPGRPPAHIYRPSPPTDTVQPRPGVAGAPLQRASAQGAELPGALSFPAGGSCHGRDLCSLPSAQEAESHPLICIVQSHGKKSVRAFGRPQVPPV